jgi:predicted transglutaminase-like cysteine proteinase
MVKAIPRVILIAVFILSAFAVQPAAKAGEGPPGFQILCITSPSVCRGGGASQVMATASLMATLQSVNRRINRSIRPKADEGVDRWVLNASAGDCEDYALSKRAALIGASIPASSLRIAYVKTPGGQDHAVLVVNTTAGRLVLDNLEQAIIPLSQTRYRVVSMQTANPRQWT